VAHGLQSLEFARYRGFRDMHQPQLSRLNLVYGENNAGKSAFVRVPALLAASRTPGRAGLDLGEPVRHAGFKEVQWRGPLPDEADPDLVLGVGLSDGSLWRWTFRWVDMAATSAIQSIELANGSDRLLLETGLVFDGIIPRAGVDALIDRCRDGLASALDGVIWLEAKREAPSREGTARDAPGALTSTGEGAAALVAADVELRNAVSAWFREHVQCSVEVESLGRDRHRLVLRPSGAAFDVPFPDAGEGLQQVFAVVTALEHLRREGGLLCVEEPESHLHPRLQRALATLFIDVLVAQPSASVLLETHAEVFLLSALTAAADGLRDAVCLHWVQAEKDGVATIKDIDLDEEGRPTTPLLEQAFDTMGVMRREVIQARRLRSGAR
jgi:predicted ATPase